MTKPLVINGLLYAYYDVHGDTIFICRIPGVFNAKNYTDDFFGVIINMVEGTQCEQMKYLDITKSQKA